MKPRYLEQRRLKGGEVKYYWNPPAYAKPHFACRALGADYTSAVMEAESINKALDAWRDDSTSHGGGIQPGSVGELMTKFQRSQYFSKTRPVTQESYSRMIEYFLDYSHGNLGKVRDMNARRFGFAHADSVYNGIVKQRGVGTGNHMMGVTRRAWRLGIRWGLVDNNPWTAMELIAMAPRKVVWTHDQLALFIETAKREQMPEMGLAVLLAFELCQRQGDILALTWAQYDGEKVTLKQRKTGSVVTLTCNEEVKAELALAYERRLNNHHIIATTKGAKFGENWFRKSFVRIKEAAGLPDNLWFLDLRRTGLTELGDAGATEDEIMATSGHKSRQVVSTYVQKTTRQAENAHAKRMRHRNGN
jgi:integrase